MSNISETLVPEIAEIYEMQHIIKDRLMSMLQIHKIVSVDESKIVKDIVGCIVYNRKGIGFFFIKEDTFLRNIDNILKDERIIDSLTVLKCKEDKWTEFVGEKSIIIEEYKLKDPTIPDNIITPLF